MKRLVLAAAALLAGAGVASAQSGSSPFYTSGFLQYEYLNNDFGDLSYAYADFNIGFGFGGVSSLPMGFDLGVLGQAVDDGGSSHQEYALFPTFWVDTSVGRFSVGSPRSALGSAIRFPRLGGSNVLNTELQYMTNLTDLVPLISSDMSYGLRFDGAVGSFDAGLSAHWFTGSGDDTHSVTGFVGRDYGALSFAVGIEAIDGPSISRQTYLAQVGYDAGQFGGHLTLADSNDFPDMLAAVDAYYKPIDWLTLNASYVTVGSSSDIYGVNAEASFLKNGYAGIGYIDSTSSSNGMTSVYVGWKLNY